jgi:hypothetical protein
MPYSISIIGGGEQAPNNLSIWQSVGMYAQSIVNNVVAGCSKYFFGVGASNTYSLPGFSSLVVWGAMTVALLSRSNPIEFRTAAGNVQVQVTFNPDGSVTVNSGSGALLGTAPAGSVPQNTVCQIGFHIVSDPVLGIVQLTLNGNPAPFFSVVGTTLVPVNTQPTTSSPQITNLFWPNVNAGVYFYVRDIAVHDGTGPAPFNSWWPLGGCATLPMASLVSGAFTPNGLATLLANVNNVPPAPGVNFNASATVGATDTYDVTAPPSNALAVLVLQPYNFSQKTDTGVRALQSTLTIGGTAIAGTETYLSQTMTLNMDPVIITDPATGVLLANEGAAGVAAVAGAQLSYKVAA